MRDAQSDIESAGARIVVVGNGKPHHARAFKEDASIDFTLWVDPDLGAYRAAGLRRGIASTLTLSSVGNAFRALRGGHRQRVTQGDPWQLGGTFIIAPGGRVLFEHISKAAGDHPSLAKILDVLRGKAA